MVGLSEMKKPINLSRFLKCKVFIAQKVKRFVPFKIVHKNTQLA